MSTALDKAQDRLVAAVSCAAWLDIQVEQGGDACVYRLAFRAQLVGNPRLPALHGGVVASFAYAINAKMALRLFRHV